MSDRVSERVSNVVWSGAGPLVLILCMFKERENTELMERNRKYRGERVGIKGSIWSRRAHVAHTHLQIMEI